MIRKSFWTALGVVFIAIVGLVIWIRHGEFWDIDACLDSGGAWDYAAKQCRR
jgi:hypothetical protein